MSLREEASLECMRVQKKNEQLDSEKRTAEQTIQQLRTGIRNLEGMKIGQIWSTKSPSSFTVVCLELLPYTVYCCCHFHI